MNFLFKWFVNILALFFVVHIIAGISVDSFGSMALAALVIGFLNAFLRPVLVMLTLPLTIVTLGIFTLVINAAIFYLASKLISGFNIANFWSAFWAALLFSVINFLLGIFIGPRDNLVMHRYTGTRQDNTKRYKDAIDIEAKVEK